MIAIVDYGIEKNETLAELLSAMKIDYVITDNELGILSADKVILPNTGNIPLAVKRLHLYNLFTMLRVCNKPILGISGGMNLMSSNIKDLNLSALGIFPGISKSIAERKKENFSSVFKTIIKTKESKLLKNLSDDIKLFFDTAYYLPTDDLTSAKVINAIEISAITEKEDYFGVQFLPEKSGDAGKIVLSNFFEL